VAAVEAMLAPASVLGGAHVLVTAGPTYEDLDPVRYVGNRSSGRMGLAIAAEAARRGARVTLVLGPTPLQPPAALDVVRVRSAAEMHRAVMERVGTAEVAIMAAAVADYTPAAPAPQKIAKEDGPVTLTLTRTRDILADIAALPRRAAEGRPVLVGFAAETTDVVARARAKRARKRVDLIVANDVSRSDAGFDVDTNEVTIIGADGEAALPLQSKQAVAMAILDRVEALITARAAAAPRQS